MISCLYGHRSQLAFINSKVIKLSTINHISRVIVTKLKCVLLNIYLGVSKSFGLRDLRKALHNLTLGT